MIIADNMLANGAARQLKIIGNNKKKPTERLSSGYRINRASDDAAGLSISEKMRGQIRGLTRASQNVQDGISLIQTGEGALDEVHSMLQRIRELAVEASNDTYTDDDREAIGKEVENIKDEMTRVFNEAEFNTIQIFRARYVPDIKTVPNDYELYNLSDGTPAAGVLINHKRYSWDELGAPKTSENNGWEKKFYDDNGELIWLRLEAGKDPSEMHRVYFLEADDRGIKINNLYAGEWDSTIEQNGLTYSFSFHGMDISIETRLGDSREDIISQLNPDGLSFNSWDAIPISGGRYSAVNVSGDTMTLNVTNNNKYDISDWEYSLEADNEGVALVQTNGDDGITHTKTTWSNFTNTLQGEPSYPISDWGDEAEGSNPVTMKASDGASYNYKDQTNTGYLVDPLSIDFSFPLDETSKQQAIEGLTGELTGYDVLSPVKSANTTGTAAVLTDYSGFDSFEYQRDILLRDFGTNGSDKSMEVTVDRTMNVVGKIPDYEYGKVFLTVNVNVVSEGRYFSGLSFTERIGQPEFYDENGNRMNTPSSYYYKDYRYGIREDYFGNECTYSSHLDEYHYDTNPNYVGHGYGALSTQGIEFAYTFDVNCYYTENGVTKTGKARCTYLAKNISGIYYTHRYSKDSDGNLNLYDSRGHSLDDRTVYVRTDDQTDDNAITDVRNNSYVVATSSDRNTRLYVYGGYDWVQVRSYDKCEYEYSGTNLNGEELMSCVSDYFLNTGTDGESIVLHDSEGNEITWATENYKNLENVKLVSPDDNNTYISMKYNPGIREDTTTVLINPDGPATRSFESFARSPGLATDTALTVLVNPTDKILHFQAGANAGQSIDLHLPGLSNSIIGIGGARFDSSDTASATISMADMAIEKISDVRALFGAYQNRLEHAHSINQNTAENLQNAESRIRDADMAKEAMELAKQSILEQVGQSMITQANQNTQGILKLLQ